MNLNVKGKNILVTGAAKRIGQGIALAVAREGANIALHYNNSEEEAIETAKKIEEIDGRTVLVKGDLLDLEDVQNMQKTIHQKLGKVDGIVNNAGFAQYKSFFTYKPGEWRREVDVCFYGVVHLEVEQSVFLNH